MNYAHNSPNLKVKLTFHPLNLVLFALAAYLGWQFLQWGILNATWQGEPTDCRQNNEMGSGACWAFVNEKFRLILFGRYPAEQHWRPLLALTAWISMLGISSWACLAARWKVLLNWLWLLPATLALLLFGAPTTDWGGLPLTLLLSMFGIAGAFPLGVLLALGRTSTMPVIKSLSVLFIELVRGVPLISVLFMASFLFPLFLPGQLETSQLWRAQIAIMLFASAYVAEAVRGGLQSLHTGQFEAADALGLSYWQRARLVILPQALQRVIPPLVNIFIGLFKDTSLVMIIGLFDLLLAAKTALADAPWRPFYIEAYIFIGLIYFVFCYGMSRYSRRLEQEYAE